jgi:hypothetical protein
MESRELESLASAVRSERQKPVKPYWERDTPDLENLYIAGI